MKFVNILLLFFVLFLFGCSEYFYGIPNSNIKVKDDFVTSIVFHGNIIDTEYEKIRTKDDLITYVDTAVVSKTYYGKEEYNDRHLHIFMSKNEMLYSDDLDKFMYEMKAYDYLIYVTPLSSGIPVLKFAMPIEIIPGPTGHDFGFYERRLQGMYESKQPIVLVRGDVNLADSSYRGFTILPIDNGNSINNSLDFTYIIKKTKKRKDN